MYLFSDKKEMFFPNLAIGIPDDTVYFAGLRKDSLLPNGDRLFQAFFQQPFLKRNVRLYKPVHTMYTTVRYVQSTF